MKVSFKLEKINKEVTTVHGFLESIADVRSKKKDIGHTWYFRGDKDGDPLCPSAGKDQKYAGKTLKVSPDMEHKFLHRFKRFSYPYIRQIQNDWEALCLARHYGLPTRLLDWTANPLVALYFSCSPCNENNGDGIVWGILRIKDDRDDINIIDPENDEKNPITLYNDTLAIKLIYPIYNSSRIIAQKGIFSWHSNPTIPLDKCTDKQFDQKKLDIAALVSWKIPDLARTNLVEELENLGINQRSIFPDIEGTTKAIWHTSVLWDGD